MRIGQLTSTYKVSFGGSDLSQVPKTTLEKVMPDVQWLETLPYAVPKTDETFELRMDEPNGWRRRTWPQSLGKVPTDEK